jgi:hypothetical protein
MFRPARLPLFVCKPAKLAISFAGLVAFCMPISAHASCWIQEEEEKVTEKVEMGDSIKLADEHLMMTAPKRWKKIDPRFQMIDAEFSVPAENSEIDGRITIMGAGGSVEQNMDRWKGQFSPPEGKSLDDVAKVTKMTVNGQTVHLLDVHGTFNDRPSPQAEGVKREDYRMLAAIIETKDFGNYFVKFYGNKETVAKAEKEYKAFLESLEIIE